MTKYQTSPSGSVRKELFRSGTRIKKSLGQHFLIEPEMLKIMVSNAELTMMDTVIEIGPGLGVLTEQLIKSARLVLAVEIDGQFARILQRKFKSATNIEIIHSNILQLDLMQLLRDKKSYKVVANLPYNISSPVLNYFTEAAIKPQLMVIMLQKEVADAITAPTGKLSALAIGVQLFALPSIIAHVPADYFYPRPKVDSAMLKIQFLEKPKVSIDNNKTFLDLVRKGFRAPRKQIVNSLALGMNTDVRYISSILHSANVDTEKRPEALSLNDWQRIYQILQTKGG